MKIALLSLFVAFTLLFAPIAHAFEKACDGDNCHSVVSADDGHHHDNKLQADEHAQLDFDSGGNPHNGMTHNHSHHHHGCDFNPAYTGIDLTTRSDGSLSLAYWKDNFYSDHCAGPLLEPPSHA